MMFIYHALKEHSYFLSGRIFLPFIAIFWLQSTLVFSQTQHTVLGALNDSDGLALDYISVALLKKSDSTLVKAALTDSAGSFIFENIPSGFYNVQINWVGFTPYSSDAFELTAGQEFFNLGKLTLVSEDATSESITVTARKPLIEQEADRTVLNVENSILSEGNTALEVLEKAPGVMVDNDGNITLKGKQGVMVMINGKQTYLSQRELTSLLRGTSSSSIAKVEIISNPSSKYDAAGDAGIINIVMKKNVRLGWNGTVYANVGTSRKFRNGYGLSLNYRNGRFNWFGSYDYTDRGEKEYQENTRRFDGSRTSYQTSTSIEPLYTNNFKFGMDYNINDKNAIGVLCNGSLGSYSNNSESRNLVLEDTQFSSNARSENSTQDAWSSTTYSLNYTKTFKKVGRELSADLSYGANNFTAAQLMNTTYVNTSHVETGGFIRRGNLPSQTKLYVGKLDYIHPLGKTAKLETGWKSSIVDADNEVVYDTLAGGNWQNDATMSNRFTYKENINAAYVNLSKELGKYSVQLGLRMEHTHTEGYQVTLDSLVIRDYTQLFPSLFLKRKLSEKQSLQFSYSRRIERPDYYDLNPFRFYRDPYLYYTGNPFLQPQYSNSFELSHDFNAKVITAFNYSHTTGVMTWVSARADTSNTTYERPLNLRSLSTYGISCTVNLSLTKWWTGNIFGNLNYNEYKDKNFSNGIASYSFNLQQSLTLTKGFSFEVTGTHHSKSVYGIYEIKPMYWLSLGVQKQVLKKLTLKLSVNDVFQTKRYIEHAAYQNVDMTSTVRPDSRNIMFSMSYRFGNNSLTRTRKSDSDDVQNRTKGGK